MFDALPQPEGGRPDVTLFFGPIIAVVAFFFFLLGLIYAQIGITILVGTASYRATRRPDHEYYFASGKTSQERLANLDQADRERATSDNGVSFTRTTKL